MAPGRSSGFRVATPTLFIPLASLLGSRTPPTLRGVRACTSLPCVTWAASNPLRLGGLVFQMEMVGVEEVENQQPQGSEGEAGREQRVSRWRRWAGKGIQARHVLVA